MTSRTLSISIDASPKAVYACVSDPRNLPKWAGGLCKSVRRTGGDWIVESPQGPMKIRFAPENEFGVLDHYVLPAPDTEIYVPMRVVQSGAGSEVLLTLFRAPEMSDAQYAEDIRLVEHDLATLKRILETGEEQMNRGV